MRKLLHASKTSNFASRFWLFEARAIGEIYWQLNGFIRQAAAKLWKIFS
jgi:hypothetical protein